MKKTNKFSQLRKRSFPVLLLLIFFLPGWCFAALTFIQKSEPAGLISQTTQYYDLNDSFLTHAAPERTGGYAFTHWTVNGNRTEIPTLSVSLQITGKVTANTIAIAHYSTLDDDTDNDGIEDWFELRSTGTLQRLDNSDDDNDSIPLGQEFSFGLNPNSTDQIHQGGLSIRRSSIFFANLGGARKLTIRSNPPGLVASELSYPEVNSTFVSATLSGAQSGFYFSHWEVNGIRKSDSIGKGLSQVAEVMETDKEVVAKFIPIGEDMDSDKIPDWYEWHELGTLQFQKESNPDQDQFSLEEEIKFGMSGKLKDTIVEGGISMRRSKATMVNLGSGSFVELTSDPPGMVETQSILKEMNATFESPSLNGKVGTFVFSHWEVNGIRKTNSTGMGLSKVIEKLDADKTIVAKYIDESLDYDNDGIPDWYESQQFGSLDLNESSDPDSDGFINVEEIKFGQSPLIKDTLNEGGIAIRRSATLSYVKDLSDSSNAFDSDGDGLSDRQEIELGSNATLIDSDGDGFSDYEEFLEGSNLLDAKSFPNQIPNGLYLSSDKIRENQAPNSIVGHFLVSDPNPNSTHLIDFVESNQTTFNQLFWIDENQSLHTKDIFDYETKSTFKIKVRATDEGNLSIERSFSIEIENIVEDMDGDGIEDHIDTDDDGDGFSDLEEMSFGSDPQDPNSVANSTPRSLQISQNTIPENLPSGSIIGRLSADDPDGNETLRFLLAGVPDLNNSLPFEIDHNKSLRSTEVFDYESKNQYEITILAVDEYNASTENNFTINVINIMEDLDADGIEDLFDKDMDGDGFSNEEEIKFGSDPKDPKSLANSPPHNLILKDLVLFENSPIGTNIGFFHGIDLDGNTSLSYTFTSGKGSVNNTQFKLEENGTLLTDFIFDYESESNVSIRVKVRDQHNASLERAFTFKITDLFEEKKNRVPLVRTATAKYNLDQSLRLSGMVMEAGDSKINESGFLISKPDSNESILITSDFNSSNSTFQSDIKGLKNNQVYLFKAFAKSAIGTGYGATRKLRLINYNDSSVWWSDLSTNLVDGWIIDSWMGSLLPFSSKWAFHPQLNWIYMHSDGSDGYWIWKNKMGWTWTHPKAWPFFWSQNSANWLYLFSNERRSVFYDYAIEEIR